MSTNSRYQIHFFHHDGKGESKEKRENQNTSHIYGLWKMEEDVRKNQDTINQNMPGRCKTFLFSQLNDTGRKKQAKAYFFLPEVQKTNRIYESRDAAVLRKQPAGCSKRQEYLRQRICRVELLPLVMNLQLFYNMLWYL